MKIKDLPVGTRILVSTPALEAFEFTIEERTPDACFVRFRNQAGNVLWLSEQAADARYTLLHVWKADSAGCDVSSQDR